ncbi:MAG: T9SS type A sorting domain-containing protein, partial [Saprospiraceae bacterium]|nr:T9SS type A sorting domain-containing protein [Saprospiraceae bacterium]
YMADENYESDIKILDLSELPDIMIPNTFNAEAVESSITHNQIIHGNKLYVSYYVDGLQVFDISDPVNPVREMYYDTSTEAPGPGRYRGAWGVYPFLSSGNILVSDMQNGLFVIDSNLPTSSSSEIQNSFSLSSFPNPTTGSFQITLPPMSETPCEIKIFNEKGILVASRKSSQSIEHFNLDGHPIGTYLIVYQSHNKILSSKFILAY